MGGTSLRFSPLWPHGGRTAQQSLLSTYPRQQVHLGSRVCRSEDLWARSSPRAQTSHTELGRKERSLQEFFGHSISLLAIDYSNGCLARWQGCLSLPLPMPGDMAGCSWRSNQLQPPPPCGLQGRRHQLWGAPGLVQETNNHDSLWGRGAVKSGKTIS